MATRSTIAIERDDGTIAMVYCHWDGYLNHNGRILYEYYSDPEKLEQLIALGDLSVLGSEIGEKHDFGSSIDNWCKFYGRDRGEVGVGAKVYANFDDYVANHQYEKYEYLLGNDGVWSVDRGNGHEPLLDQLYSALLDQLYSA